MLDGISLQALSLPLAILQGIERRIHKLQQERQEKTVGDQQSCCRAKFSLEAISSATGTAQGHSAPKRTLDNA
jgi:hypothetical protein